MDRWTWNWHHEDAHTHMATNHPLAGAFLAVSAVVKVGAQGIKERKASVALQKARMIRDEMGRRAKKS
jgi:hypothetical protein